MSDNTGVISRLLTAYQQLDPAAMEACYHEQATFQDIAFRLNGKSEIGAMWRMICKNGIQVAIDEPPRAAGEKVVARITDTYIFSDTKRKVVNRITCHFYFRDGLIVEHQDECDPKDWARQALGGVTGWLAGRVGFLRRRKARKKLDKFIAEEAASA
jgi:hypothetical protein